MLKFYAGIVLYNPNEKDIQNILNYKNAFDKVIIYDNSDNGSNNAIFFNEGNWIYCKAELNNGISKAINYMIDMCVENNIDFLCTLDQDSLFSLKHISVLKQYIEDDFTRDIAVYAPQIVYLNRKQNLVENGVEERKWVITSGNFVNIKLISQKSVRYDEEYFIDRCDRDFCMQITQANYKIVVNNESILYQQLGVLEENGRMGHSALRHYYCFRNRLYYNNKYYTGLEKVLRNVLQTIRQLSMIIIGESDKFNKIKMFNKAVADYSQGRMGKYEN